MLGVDPDEVNPDQEGNEALRELANIICGEVIQSLGGMSTRFELGLPSSIEQEPRLEDCNELVLSTVESDYGTMRISVARAKI
jgi:CheY-specific phosphatase CheX